jgi:hypothetical protein
MKLQKHLNFLPNSTQYKNSNPFIILGQPAINKMPVDLPAVEKQKELKVFDYSSSSSLNPVIKGKEYKITHLRMDGLTHSQCE